MTSATEKLRRLLDERGVKWRDVKYGGKTYGVKWRGVGGMYFLATEYDNLNGDGTVYLQGVFMTPEQAIAATLGNPTCEYVIEDNMNESEGMGDVWFRCTNCDTRYDYQADDWLMKMPHCPKCGATVKGVR